MSFIENLNWRYATKKFNGRKIGTSKNFFYKCSEIIDSCPMEGFEPLSFQKELNLSEYIIPCALLALGYRAADDEAQKFAKTRFTKEDLFTKI